MPTSNIIRILTGALLIALLLFLGWGIHDAASFFSSAARTAFLPLILVGLSFARVSVKHGAKKGARTPAGQMLVLASVRLVTIPLLLLLTFVDHRSILVMHAEWVRWLGLAVTLAGYVVILVALQTLGRNYRVYVTIQEQHRLVQHGIYGVVRNPIYLGTMLAWPGTCLVFRSWLVFPVFLYFLTFAVLRGAQEERLLREEFTSEFDAYCGRTWRLVPYVY